MLIVQLSEMRISFNMHSFVFFFSKGDVPFLKFGLDFWTKCSLIV